MNDKYNNFLKLNKDLKKKISKNENSSNNNLEYKKEKDVLKVKEEFKSTTYEEEFPNAIDFDKEVENFEVSNRKINEYQYDRIVRYLGTFGAISIENKKIYQEDIDYDTYLKIAKKLGFNGVNKKMFDEGSILNPSDLEKVDIRLEEIESLFKQEMINNVYSLQTYR